MLRRIDVDKVLRLTGAATVAYVVAGLLTDASLAILAPLTALLVVQVTLVGIVRSSIDRVLAVVAGVLIAAAFSRAVGVTWWSLALLIAASLVLGQLLRLGDNLLEVPISAMIVITAGASGATVVQRIVETLIGAACGLLVNVVVPPRVRVVDAAGAVRDLASRMGDVVERLAGEVEEGLTLEQAERLVEDMSRLAGEVGEVDRALLEAEESRRLNPRAIGTEPTSGAQLRAGLTVLEHTAVAMRGLSRSIADAVAARERRSDGYSPEARAALAQLLREQAEALRAYGRLVYAEVQVDTAPGAVRPRERELSALLEALREARVRLTELLLADPAVPGSSWELNGAILTSVERVLRELDAEERARLRQRLAAEPQRSSTAGVVGRLRQVADAAEAVVDVVVEAPRRGGRLRRWPLRRRAADAIPAPQDPGSTGAVDEGGSGERRWEQR